MRCSQSTARVASGEPTGPRSRGHRTTSCWGIIHFRGRRGRGVEAGSAPEVQEERDEVVVGVAGLDRRTEVRLHLSRQRKLEAGFVGGVEHEIDVLLHQRRRERRREVVTQERLRLVLHERRADGGARYHFEERCAGDAGGLAEDQRLGDRLRKHRDHQVDRELHGPSLLSVADMMDRRTDRPDHRLDVVERLARSGDDEAQVSRAHDARVAADGCTQIANRRRLRKGGDARRSVRRDGAHVDEHGVRPRSGDNPSRHLLECLVIRERREDHVDLCDELLGRGRDCSAQRAKGVGLPTRSVVHHERIASVEEALRDRRAHVAEADQSHGPRVLRGSHCPV